VAEVQPFRGVLYRVPESDLPRVLAPPYDVISPALQAELYARDPRNVVRLVLNREQGDAGYEEAGRTYRRWIADGTLAADPAPAVYLLEQSFEVDGRTLRRYGLLTRFRAEDVTTRVILPHEQTRKAAKEDRFRVLKATGANFSPIFLMFPDPEARFSALAAEITGSPPTLRYADESGVGHRLWRLAEPGSIGAFTKLLVGTRAYIADGHHRHATALRYRDEAGPEGAWTLGYFTPMGAPGLLVLPYHRLLSAGPSLDEARRKLETGGFRTSAVPSPAEAARAAGASKAPHAFALAAPGATAVVAEALPEALRLLAPDVPPSLRALDTYFFHNAVMPRFLSVPEDVVSYVHSFSEAEDALRRGACRLAAFMRATPVHQIVDVADAGESMPAKSTFFHPKLPSGLVIHPLALTSDMR
jgi:uncharacterized protein (DUF1015 family)